MIKEFFVKLSVIIGNRNTIILEGTFIGDEFLVYEDNWGRKWKLVPNTNENIIMPFIITPLEARK